MPEYYNWTSQGEGIVQDYIEAPSVPQVSKSTTTGHVEGVPNDGTRSCPVDAILSSYCYGGGPYDYDESGLRLYSSRTTVEHMTWHATHQTEEGSMYNPSDAEAWKHFDQMYPDFAEELHNVRLGLYAVGFAPHEELLQLWHVGVRTYGHATDRDFIMRATLMWTANDLTAYGMASGWSTVGVM
ncbi:UNVERIFIED_CONTAM: hypothetical protein Scaly_3080000 [Sesamum calycinum]|uniref:Uncharacterized protein n=1 Tax=Sesamum calycinum TaxID=2727403 RepID=A0AAW2JUW6_9LAMI